MLNIQEITFLQLNGKKCLSVVALAASFPILFAVLVTLSIEPGRRNYIPPVELTVICFGLWALLSFASVTRGLWEFLVMKRNFAQSPFDQLTEIGFLIQKRNAKRIFHITGIQYFRVINGFPIVAHVDFEGAPKLVKFSAQINPIRFEKARFSEIDQTFLRHDIEWGIGEVSKFYSFKGHQLSSIKSLELELFEFTDQLAKYGFIGGPAWQNSIYTQ